MPLPAGKPPPAQYSRNKAMAAAIRCARKKPPAHGRQLRKGKERLSPPLRLTAPTAKGPPGQAEHQLEGYHVSPRTRLRQFSKKHGAISHSCGYYRSGTHAGQMFVAFGYPDLATQERAIQGMLQEADWQRVSSELEKLAPLQELYLTVVTEEH